MQAVGLFSVPSYSAHARILCLRLSTSLDQGRDQDSGLQ
jgi:hypothetical protein